MTPGRNSHRENQKQSPGIVLWKNVLLKVSQNLQENKCARVCNFIKKETLAQVFSYEFYEIFKNTFFYRTTPGDCFWRTSHWDKRLCSGNVLQEIFHSDRNNHRTCSIKIDVLKNFVKFTGKHLCQSLFFNKVASLRPLLQPQASDVFKNTFVTEHLWTTASEHITRIYITDNISLIKAVKNISIAIVQSDRVGPEINYNKSKIWFFW